MALTNAELFAHAEHCLRTGQPKLANLYMRKLIERVQADRKQFRADWFKARQAAGGMAGVVAVFEEFAENAKRAFTEAFGPVLALFEDVSANYQGSYALVPMQPTTAKTPYEHIELQLDYASDYATVAEAEEMEREGIPWPICGDRTARRRFDGHDR